MARRALPAVAPEATLFGYLELMSAAHQLKNSLRRPTSQTPDLIRGVLRGAQISWATAREAGASLLIYELYPLGVVSPKLPVLRKPFSKSQEQRPVLFVHGLFHNRSTFTWLAQRLAWQGWRHFREINLYSSFHRLPTLAEKIAHEVERMKKRYRTDQIDIVAHSMGGLISRYYVQKLGGDGQVKNFISLGTPHRGIAFTKLGLLRQLRELSPDSAMMTELNSLALPTQTQCLAVSGSLDLFAQPKTSGFWPGVRNIGLKRVGHAGLLFSTRVAEIVLAHLPDKR